MFRSAFQSFFGFMSRLVPRLMSHRVVSIAGYVVFFSVMFVFFLVLGFPVDRFKPIAEQQATGFLDKEITIGKMEMSLFGNLVLSNIEIGVDAEQNATDMYSWSDSETKKPQPGEKQPPKISYLIEEASVDVGLLALLFDKLDLEIDMEALGGEIEVTYDGPIPGKSIAPQPRRRSISLPKSKENTEAKDNVVPVLVRIDASEIQLNRFYDLKEALPVPVSGEMSFSADIASKTDMFADASGQIRLQLKNVVLSKANYEATTSFGKTKVPPLRIDSFDLSIKIENGIGKIDKFEIKSKHIDLKIEGTVNLSDPLTRSRFDLYIALKLDNTYINQSDSLKTLLSMNDAIPDLARAKRDDGYYGFRYRGMLGRGRFSPQKQPSSSRTDRGRFSHTNRARPLGARAGTIGEGTEVNDDLGERRPLPFPQVPNGPSIQDREGVPETNNESQRPMQPMERQEPQQEPQQEPTPNLRLPPQPEIEGNGNQGERERGDEQEREGPENPTDGPEENRSSTVAQ